MYTPQGIFYWSARAKNEAEIDGTIGIAQDDDGTISHLKIAEEWAGEKISARELKGKIFGYAPIEGVTSLREKWLKKILSKHPELTNSATLSVVTNGITHSLALAGRLFLNPGETLITAHQSWENYEHIYTDTQGIKMELFPLFTENGEFNIEALAQTCVSSAKTQKKVVLLLNFPHNQTGFMPSQAEALACGEKLKQLYKEFSDVPFVILLDDAYEGYVYDKKGQSCSILSQVFAKAPNLTVVKMDGISKVLLSYGYRVGFITFFLNSLDGNGFFQEDLKKIRAEVGSKVGGFIRGEISQVNHHGQVLADALMDEMETVEREREEVISQLATRWQKMIEALENGYKKYGKEKLWADPCNGGFFCYVNLSPSLDPKQVAERLLKERKVGVVPGVHGLRVAFAGTPKDKVPQMIEAIFEVVHG